MESKPPEPAKKRVVRHWKQRFAVLGICYLLFIMFGGCADQLILHGSTDKIHLYGQQRQTIDRGDGRVLEAWAMRSFAARDREPEAFVLHFIGNASRGEYEASDVATLWNDIPIEAWGVNYPGYGGSSGSPSLKSIPSSALAAYDALKKRAGNRPIFVSGRSLGTTAALHVAANRPVAGMVFWSPPPIRNLILTRFGWWNLWLIAGPVAMNFPDQLDSLKNAPKVDVPAVFILTQGDSVVPVKYQNKVHTAYAGPKKAVLFNGNHNDVLDTAATTEMKAALDWLWETTKGSNGGKKGN